MMRNASLYLSAACIAVLVGCTTDRPMGDSAMWENCDTPFSHDPLVVPEGTCDKFIGGRVISKMVGSYPSDMVNCVGPFYKSMAKCGSSKCASAGASSCKGAHKCASAGVSSCKSSHKCASKGHMEEGNPHASVMMPQGICQKIGGIVR